MALGRAKKQPFTEKRTRANDTVMTADDPKGRIPARREISGRLAMPSGIPEASAMSGR